MGRRVGPPYRPSRSCKRTADGRIDRSEVRDTPWDPLAEARSCGCLELASRKPSWPAVKRPHQQAGHMDASDPIRPQKTLVARGPSTYGSRRSPGRLADGSYAMTSSLRFRAAIVSIALFLAFVGIWHIATRGTGTVATMSPEYAKLMGLTATQGKSAMPGPLDVATKLWDHIMRPFYDNGPNDKGLGIQLGYSIARVGLGYLLAVLIAIPLGFLIGMSPLINRALDPFIQILKPISPLAWMPLALYTIKDSVLSAIFVIFICSVWPLLLNTAFGVAAVRKEWINVARTLEVGTVRRAFPLILPAAAPTILTGMRISIGIAWLVIVAAEMLVGGTCIGYFVWNEWNNLSITNVIIAILLIGLVGMLLDQILARFTRMVTFPE